MRMETRVLSLSRGEIRTRTSIIARVCVCVHSVCMSASSHATIQEIGVALWTPDPEPFHVFSRDSILQFESRYALTILFK